LTVSGNSGWITPDGDLIVVLSEEFLKIRSSGLDLTFLSRNMNGSPAGTSSFTQATPAPSCPRLCCFSIRRKSFVKPQSGVPYFSS
jgi:hypothetical protein